MRGDKLYRGIGDADEKYIKSAEKAFKAGEGREKRRNAGRIIKRVLSVAAAVVIIGGLWVVSFIVAQKRQEPDHPASTGEPVTDDSETYSPDKTNDEPSTEADTTFILNPSDTEQAEIYPDNEYGKMKQAFDEYLKTKEFGQYGDYFVSYCVKVNGAYIGFINDGTMDYTMALENEVIDGLPFCYGNGQELTVINGGEYRYGLAKAFSDGIINSDILDQFFVKYSSDQYMFYKDYESGYLRQSCEEFLDGEDERNVIDKPEKDKELTLFNYIHIAFCKKLGGYKYAVLYQLTHQPIEVTDGNEFYMVYINEYNYSFYVNNGLMLKVLDEIGNISSLDDSDISGDEFKELYDSYTAFWESANKRSEETREPDTTETEFTDVEFEWLDFTDTDRITDAEKAKELSGVFDEYLRGEPNPGIDFCVKLGNGKYAALLERHISPLCIESTENVGGYPIHYSNYRKMTVLSGDTAYFGLQNAYEHNVLTDSDAHEIFTSYRDAFRSNYEDEMLCSLLVGCFREYLNGNTLAYRNSGYEGKVTLYKFINIEFCAELSANKYAALFSIVDQEIPEFDEMSVIVSDHEFIYKNGLELKILNIDNISGLSEGVLTGVELDSLYGSYEEYLSKNNNGRAPWNVPELREKFETFITTGEAYNVDYAYKTKDGIYIGIFSRGDLEQWEETVAGYTFEHGTGNKYLVIKDDTLTEGLKEAYDSGIISAETVKEFYIKTVKEFYINLSKFFEEQNDNQNHSGYETTVKLIRHYWDGYGVSSKTVSTCDLAYSIIDAIDTLNKTGETVNKISDDTMDESNGYFPEGIQPGTLWLEVGSKIYRIAPDLSKIALVETHFGKGYVLNMTDELRSLLNIAWYYYPRNTYVGTYDNGSGKLDMSHTYTADSTIEIKIKDLYVEKKIDASNNSVTVEVTSSIDQTVEVYASSYQSDDNLGSDDAKTISLKANETKELTFEFYGWYSYPYMLDIAADNTRVTLTIIP